MWIELHYLMDNFECGSNFILQIDDISHSIDHNTSCTSRPALSLPFLHSVVHKRQFLNVQKRSTHRLQWPTLTK